MSGKTTILSLSIFAALLIVATPNGRQAAEASQSSAGAPSSTAVQEGAAPAAAPSAPSPAAGETQSQTEEQAKPSSPAPALDARATAWKMLTDGASSDKYPTRSDAIAALAVLETDRRAVRLTITALGDKESIIRVQAATSLGEVKARAAIPALRAMLEDKEPQVTFAAAQALWKMNDRSGREVFYEVLDGERKTQPGIIKANIAKAKAEMHDPKGLVLIGINSASSAFLGPGVLGVSAVEELATNTSAPVQALCAKLLGDDDNRETVEELKQALGDKNWTVRAAAARALANMNHPEAIPALLDMMQNDKKQAARFAAAAAVIHLDQRQRSRLNRKAAAARDAQPKHEETAEPESAPPAPQAAH